MLLTIHLPCTHCNPASMISHLEESIIKGSLAISGSEPMRLRKSTITCFESSKPSSMLMSRTCAPLSTCCNATLSASWYFPSRMSLANFAEPVTLVRSPILTKLLSGRMVSGSMPLSCVYGLASGMMRGGRPLTASAIAQI